MVISTTRKQGDSDGLNRQKFVGIDRFWRISDERVRRYHFVGKKEFVGISLDLPTTFWRIPRNVILTNFRRYSNADTRDQSSSEKLYTDGLRFVGKYRRPKSSENTNAQRFVGIYQRTKVPRKSPTNHCPSVFSEDKVRRYSLTPSICRNISILNSN